MNFKEALIAHLQGEKVEVYSDWPAYDKPSDSNRAWRSFGEYFKGLELGDVDDYCEEGIQEFRLAPRKILVNGVEVPAPEQAAPDYGATHYVPMPSWAVFFMQNVVGMLLAITYILLNVALSISTKKMQSLVQKLC